MILGSPALRLLARTKLRAAARKQLRRLRKPSGWIFGLLGLLLVGGWVASLVIGRSFAGFGRGGNVAADVLDVAVRFGIFVVAVMTVLSALNHRGLYLPKEEIERLFAAPLERADLIRYRLTTSLMRSLFAGVVFGLLSLGRLPVPAFGFVGIVVTMLTLPMLGQAASLFFGDAENRLGRLLSGRWTRVLQAVAALALWGLIVLAVFGDHWFDGIDANPRSFVQSVLDSSWLHAILLPAEPWARMITAPDGLAFAGWLAVCLVLWVVGFEATARIPIDYRELSLETSADVARRLNRMRRGGLGAGVAKASTRTVGWNVPWLFGRSSFGAIAWLKLGAILRKARGTVMVSLLIVGALSIAFTYVFRDEGVDSLVGGSVAIAVLGTIYLCAGLRFDFRSDLDQMETIKAWPVRPTAAFLATLLPEVVLVSAVLTVAIFARAAILASFHPALLGLCAVLPPVIFAWVALDNAVFLFAPVRYVPGQEGALHHMGRSTVLMLVRMLLLAFTAAATAVPVVGTLYVAGDVLQLSDAVSWTIAGSLGLTVLLVVDGLLVLLGGWAFRRFDVATLVG